MLMLKSFREKVLGVVSKISRGKTLSYIVKSKVFGIEAAFCLLICDHLE
jgi:hypothetical protein